jgi:hypothetical protein
LAILVHRAALPARGQGSPEACDAKTAPEVAPRGVFRSLVATAASLLPPPVWSADRAIFGVRSAPAQRPPHKNSAGLSAPRTLFRTKPSALRPPDPGAPHDLCALLGFRAEPRPGVLPGWPLAALDRIQSPDPTIAAASFASL